MILNSIPVIMYHSVGVPDDQWIFGFLTCPYGLFEKQLIELKRNKVETVSLYEYWKNQGIQSNKNDFKTVLTFDDGYLDNWVYAFPLLKKHGLKGTVFVNPECVDPRNLVRSNLEDVWAGKCSMDALPTRGFLSWNELTIMQESGVMDIQSHCMSHDWYFCGPKIVDFHHPCDDYVWLGWNARPERRHLYMSEDQSRFVPWGTPVYEHGRALGVRRYFEDQSLSKCLADFVVEKGGLEFFKQANWRQTLFKVADDYKKSKTLQDRLETDEELKQRQYHEIAGSKQLLEKKLGKPVDFLCWPGGAFRDECLAIAEEAGYRAVTLPSRLKKTPSLEKYPGQFSDQCSWIKRNGAAFRFVWRGRFIGYTSAKYWMNSIKFASGKSMLIWRLRYQKIIFLFSSYMRSVFSKQTSFE